MARVGNDTLALASKTNLIECQSTVILWVMQRFRIYDHINIALGNGKKLDVTTKMDQIFIVNTLMTKCDHAAKLKCWQEVLIAGFLKPDPSG